MIKQFNLPLAGERDFAAEPFITSACNASAVAQVMAGPAWPGSALALVGPPGSGKSHLAAQWAAKAGVGARVIDNADAVADAEALFHLLNRAQSGELTVLMTSRLRPADWTASLPDLRSRLNALPVAELCDPDDELLAAILRALFAQRFIRPREDVIPYLISRMERSFQAARDIVERLDAAGSDQKREISRALAVRELEVAGVTNDLFDDRV